MYVMHKIFVFFYTNSYTYNKLKYFLLFSIFCFEKKNWLIGYDALKKWYKNIEK